MDDKKKWITVNDFTSEVNSLSDANKKEIIQKIRTKSNTPYEFNYAIESLENNKSWYIYEGDLILDKSFSTSSDAALIVNGNLIINGVYVDYKTNYPGNVVVLGNMEAEHILSFGTLTVLGDITVNGLIYNFYNGYVFECSGRINCKAFYVSDKDTIYKNELLVTDFLRDYDGFVTGPVITDFFIEDVLYVEDDWEDDYDADEVNSYTTLDWDKVKALIEEGKNIFK